MVGLISATSADRFWICEKNYENSSTFAEVIVTIKVVHFFLRHDVNTK